MAHKTLIGGTAYEIKGGRTLVGGTGYDIKGGRTLVGGTAYDVSFGEPVTVNVYRADGTANTSTHYAEINGVKYSSTQTKLQVMPGDTIKFCYTQWNYQIAINGASQICTQGTVFEWVVPDGIKTVSVELSGYVNSSFIVTTSNRTYANVTVTGEGNGNGCYVTINGKTYSSAVSGAIAVQHGDIIGVRCRANAVDDGQIYYRNRPLTNLTSAYGNHNFVVPSVTNVNFELLYGNYGDGFCGNVMITIS